MEKRIIKTRRRKSPYKHSVQAHTRKGAPVQKYLRGKGTPPPKPPVKLPQKLVGKGRIFPSEIRTWDGTAKFTGSVTSSGRYGEYVTETGERILHRAKEQKRLARLAGGHKEGAINEVMDTRTGETHFEAWVWRPPKEGGNIRVEGDSVADVKRRIKEVGYYTGPEQGKWAHLRDTEATEAKMAAEAVETSPKGVTKRTKLVRRKTAGAPLIGVDISEEIPDRVRPPAKRAAKRRASMTELQERYNESLKLAKEARSKRNKARLRGDKGAEREAKKENQKQSRRARKLRDKITEARFGREAEEVEVKAEVAEVPQAQRARRGRRRRKKKKKKKTYKVGGGAIGEPWEKEWDIEEPRGGDTRRR